MINQNNSFMQSVFLKHTDPRDWLLVNSSDWFFSVFYNAKMILLLSEELCFILHVNDPELCQKFNQGHKKFENSCLHQTLTRIFDNAELCVCVLSK